MSIVLNDRDVLMQGVATRFTANPGAGILLTPSSAAFDVSLTGVSTPSTLTFTAKLLNLGTGAVTFSATGGTLSVVGNVATLAYSNMPGKTATVTASITVAGVLYTATASVAKITTAVASTDITGQLTSDQIASIAAAKIAGQLTSLQLSAIEAAKISGQLTNLQLEAIAAAKITGQINDTQIAAGAITAGKIAAGAIVAGDIAAGAITTTKLSAGAVTAAEIAAGAIVAGKIAALAVTATELAAGSVSAGKIAAGAIVAGDIAAGAITTVKLAAGAITADLITAGTMTAERINGGTFAGASISIGSSAGGTVFNVSNNGTVVGYRQLDGYNITAGYLASPGTPSIKGTGNAAEGVFGYNSSGNAGGHGVRGQAATTGNLTSFSSGLVGAANGYDFYADGTGINYGPFTGAHDAVWPNNGVIELGDIVVDVACVARGGWSNTLFQVARSSMPYQKAAVGVLANILGPLSAAVPAVFIQRTPSVSGDGPSTSADVVTTTAPEYDLLKGEYQLGSVNALGEGQMNVCGEGGDIAAGDLIVTSSIPGKGMRQADDLMRSYTVAKAREGVTFSSPTEIKQIACFYTAG